MHLVAPLAAGIVGAENGAARLYRRGTSTRATVYYDFEASTADSSGDDIALDSTGGVVVYVNELVEVRVYSNLGELLRDFVAGDQAYAVEAISPAFTGTDYVTGASGASKPTTAGAIFDLWKASSGAIDWNVLFTGAATSLQNALGSIYGMFFNVKSPQFGAVGDGSTDDTASFQAAHDAAELAGQGIVVVPPGVYNISASISWKCGVHLFCVPDSVTIRVTSASTPHIAIVSSAANQTGTPTYFVGAKLDSTVTNNASQFSVGHNLADEVIIDSFNFLASDFCTGAALVIGASSGRTQLRNSIARARASVALVRDASSLASTARLWIDNCDFSSVSNMAYSQNMILGDGNEVRVTRCRFFFQSTSGNTVGIYILGTTYQVLVSGCSFVKNGSGDVALAVVIKAGLKINVDDSNYFGPGIIRYFANGTTDIAAAGSYLTLLKEDVAVITGATAVIPDELETYWARVTYAVGAPDWIMPKIYFYGQRLTFVVFNGSGSLWGSGYAFTDLSTNGTSYSTASGAVALDNNQTSSLQFVAVNHNSTPYWVQVGGAGTAMPL